MASQKIYETLASVFSYPTEDIFKQAGWLYDLSPISSPDGVSAVQPFHEFISANRPAEIEETFTRTFDLNPSCCLEVGWHLYGEDYQRGEFLVNMRQALEEEGIPESTELPDHLSHCLRLLTRLEPEDEQAFAQDFLQPAIAKIINGMEEDNPYTCVIEWLQQTLEQAYGPTKPVEENTDSRLIELPVLNNSVHYNNIEDMMDDRGKVR
ncbi:MAG: molecular chaperone TorD family protein [Gammaproteobacteria bacterium]|jgi:nitrate reductase delta subunit|nr:molecular chaperone TorD family protein [Gammaproteobacteria bacterium]